MLDAVSATEGLGRTLEAVQLSTGYSTDSGLKRQLYQVARLIKAREVRKSERDFFFVQTGGWDMHSNMLESINTRFDEVDEALHGFYEEMNAQGNWNKVVFVSESEFGRSLDSNGGGSDHAWGGNHFVASGALDNKGGGKFVNSYITNMTLGGDFDLGRGSMIPRYPWESVMAPIGKWLGLNDTELNTTLPNLKNFNNDYIAWNMI